MSREFDVIIVGAGALGAAMAAVLLARKQVSPERIALVADRIEAPIPAAGAPVDFDLRVFALSRASQRLLKIGGIWDRLPAHRMLAYERMCVWDSDGFPEGSASLTFDCAEIGEANLGHIVEGRALHQGCLQAAREAGAVLIEAALRDVRIGADAARVVIDDGREICAKLLIGADGTSSKTRELLGIDAAGHAYHQDALAAHVRTEKSHRNTAWQRFLPQGPLAFLPLPDGRSSIVWSVPRGEAARLRALDPAGFGEALRAASGEVLGAIELTTPVASFPLHLQYALEYSRPRAVLLGDAAHVVHPLAGQGLNLGFLDCAALAEVLGQTPDLKRLGEYRQLRRYERRRKSENLIAAAALDGLERLFASPNPGTSQLRRMGLEAVGKLPFIRRQLAQRALGLTGDLPAFLSRES